MRAALANGLNPAGFMPVKKIVSLNSYFHVLSGGGEAGGDGGGDGGVGSGGGGGGGELGQDVPLTAYSIEPPEQNTLEHLPTSKMLIFIANGLYHCNKPSDVGVQEDLCCARMLLLIVNTCKTTDDVYE
jgi:hypothetical protein